MNYQIRGIKTSLVRLMLLIICMLNFSSTWAQLGKLFDTDHQLSSNFATQVLQDQKGFIWITTRNGINVYDGYRFTIFSKYEKNNRGFVNNYVNCIREDKNGNILLGSNSGLIIYNRKCFTTIPMISNGKQVKTYINNILVRKNGETWVCTSGYGIMKLTDGKQCVRLGGVLKPYQYIAYANEDKQGRVWICTEDFKLLRQEQNGKLTKWIPGTEGLKAKEIKQDSKGNIYLGTEQQGVYVLRPGGKMFMRINAIGNISLSELSITKDDQIHLGTNGNGILLYNPKDNTLQDNPYFSGQINLSKTKVNSIIEDKQGNLWFCMFQKGVYMQPKPVYDFTYMGYRLGKKNLIGEYCVNSVALGQNGNIWVGTDKDGVYEMDDRTHTTKHFTNVPPTIVSMDRDLQGNIWIGTYREGCGYIDTMGNYHALDLKPGTTLSVFSIKCDNHGNTWFATMGNGLYCLRKDGSIRNFMQKEGADSNGKLNCLPNNYLTELAFSKDYRKLYVATSTGLACLDTQTGSWTSTFGTNCINRGTFPNHVMCDRNDNLWFGTEDGAFFYPRGNFKHPKKYTIKEGLANNNISFFAEDNLGRIWIGTCHGLSRLDPKTQKINNYYVENGLQSNEFSIGAVATSPDGKFIVMGGTGGINWFTPLSIRQHKWHANIYISQFIMGNTNVYPEMESGSYTITEKPVPTSDRFDLSHEDNTFSIQLSTLTYNNIEQISYAYSINGEEWFKTQPGMNELTFSRMSAGTYKFRVKALSNGQESSIREFTVVVHPVWYASLWAKLAYLLILGTLAYRYILHRKKKEQDRLILQQHIHAEEMGEAKLKFFMNISHEIRTPLTLIITPLLSLIKEDKDSRRQGIYDTIRKNSERILHLINQMMDLRKIDKGQMVMHMSETDMVSFMQDEYDLFKQQAIAKNIKFTFIHDAERQPLWIDRNNFDKVLMNLLSNAFKFTPTDGKIQMSLTHTQEHVYISIKDNGIGIPKGKLETIFQRFYQSPTISTDRNVGTGIGLDLTRSLVELHYGTIIARNNEGERHSDFEHGSEFLIRLPLGCAHLKEEEKISEEQEAAMQQNIQQEESEELMEDTNTEQATSRNVGAKSCIAIVEDDEAILEYLQEQLGKEYSVCIYHNGKEALPEIIKTQPDLVVSDIMMPEMDGNTLCTKLKSNVNTNHIPVILLTAMSREEDQLNGLQCGADAYIVKPFNMDILRRKILNLLSVRQTLRNKFSGKESQDDKVKDVELKSSDDLLMDKVMQVINDNMMDEELSVEMIANKVGISRVHLHRKMKELTNQTPHSFIRNIRLKQAAKLLRESRKSITEVMYVCGFSNPASFSTMFKNLYGCSPRDYMNRQKEL